MADMTVIVGGDPADIELYLVRFNRFEWYFLAGQGVIYGNRHIRDLVKGGPVAVNKLLGRVYLFFRLPSLGLALLMVYTDRLFMKMKKCYITLSAIVGKSEGHLKNCYLDWWQII